MKLFDFVRIGETKFLLTGYRKETDTFIAHDGAKSVSISGALARSGELCGHLGDSPQRRPVKGGGFSY